MSAVMDDIVLDANSGGSSAPREQHPTGQKIGVCVDVVNLGDRVKEFPGAPPKVSPQIAFVFQTGEKDSEGRLFELSKEMTLSSNEKATLVKFIGTWRGQPLAKDELKAGIKLSQFIGRPAALNLIGKVAKNGNTYTNIDTVTPLFPGLTPPVLPAYTRADFWEKRKAEYADGVAEFKRKAAVQAQRPHVNVSAPAPSADDAVARAVTAEQQAQDDTLPPF